MTPRRLARVDALQPTLYRTMRTRGPVSHRGGPPGMTALRLQTDMQQPGPAPVASLDVPFAPVQPAVGDLPSALLREWAPVLKPVGLGLLVALHSLEETTPGHPFYGWAHCTQTTLAATLDTSQDTIARYTGLLQVCGLLRVDEVET